MKKLNINNPKRGIVCLFFGCSYQPILPGHTLVPQSHDMINLTANQISLALQISITFSCKRCHRIMPKSVEEIERCLADLSNTQIYKVVESLQRGKLEKHRH